MHTTLKILGKAVGRAIVTLFAVLFLWNMVNPDPTVEAHPRPSAEQTQAAKVEAAIDWYGCWTSDEQAPAIPGHAIVTYKDGDPTYVSADLGFEIWQHPERNEGYRVYAFCR